MELGRRYRIDNLDANILPVSHSAINEAHSQPTLSSMHNELSYNSLESAKSFDSTDTWKRLSVAGTGK